MPSLTVAARAAFAFAGNEAETLGSAAIDVEHIFLGLCKVESIRDISAEEASELNETELQTLRQEVKAFAATVESAGLDVVRARRRLRKLWREAHPDSEEFSGHRTPRCRQVFAEAAALSKGPIDLVALMRAVLVAGPPLLDRLFSEMGIDRSRLLDTLGGPAQFREDEISKYGRDLTRLAKDGKLHRAIGRKKEMKQVARILLQAKKSNPLLVGDAGVGKTAIVEGLALQLLQADSPAALRSLRIVEVSLGALVAGTKYRGEFEERLEQVVRFAEADPSLVLFIDEIHMLLGAGDVRGAMDAANLLKPALARGTMRLIGSTTSEEYRRRIEKDPALTRRFQVVWVEEPSREATIEILDGLRAALESHHGVHISHAGIEKAVDLSIRFLPAQRLPDKAIDVIDQACAHASLGSFWASRGSRLTSTKSPAGREIGAEEVAAVVAERCRVPLERLTTEESQRLLHMEEVLSKRVIGQEPAVSAVGEAIRTAKAGLKDPRRPIGVFLFLGPTGTGKTELAKALAQFLFDDERRLIRIDMSEYAERHSLSRLIGSPPGYVDHEEGGQLTEAIRSNPYSVVLFDEIEKAHPEVLNLFLQIFDEGHLTDSHGRRAGFAEAVIILTSNLGAQPLSAGEGPAVGFALPDDESAVPIPSEKNQHELERHLMRAVAGTLSPELVNRIRQVVVFHPLSEQVVRRIIDKILDAVRLRLSERGIDFRLSESAYEVLMMEGYSRELGAREMERAIERLLVQPLGRLLLEGRFQSGARIRVIARGDQFLFENVGDT